MYCNIHNLNIMLIIPIGIILFAVVNVMNVTFCLAIITTVFEFQCYYSKPRTVKIRQSVKYIQNIEPQLIDKSL